ncbi:hypothetical protein ANO14919_071390 [Xylariales sp. No.14919]|nr:hypothetical protein ANO14919_071390 [Xylariales sp. No.14919]
MTHRQSLDVQLNAALLDFAPKYMKEHLERVAQEYDERLERELLPRLRAVLREVDQVRDTFEEHKRDAARNLRDRLDLLRFDATAIDDAIGQLHAIAPRYLALFPRDSSLALPVSIPTSQSTPSTTASVDGVFDTPDADLENQAAASPASTPETSNHGAQDSTTQAKPWNHLIKPSSLDCQVQAQVLSESSLASCSPKRPKLDHRPESDASHKRPRTMEENKNSEVVQSRTNDRVAFPNLMTGECIFYHADRKGFFVIRCEFCEPGIFTKPPLDKNRALRHFRAHDEDITKENELTNEFIFEKYAFQVDGVQMASKYWIKEHLGPEPHTFVPTAPSRVTPQADNTEHIVRNDEPIDDDFSPPFPSLRESIRSHQSDHEEDQGKPRRARRNVPRLDYAEIAAPWKPSEVDTERASKAAKTTRSAAPSKRRLTKPGMNSTAEKADSKKPFGYMSEPWPRRSAPK